MESELLEYVGLVKGHAKSARNQMRTLISLLAELEERLSALEERDTLHAQPEEAQRNGGRSYSTSQAAR